MASRIRAGGAVDPADLMTLPSARASVLLTTLAPTALEAVLRAASYAAFEAHDPISSRHAPDDALHVLVRGSAIQQSWFVGSGGDHYARPIGAGDVVGLTDVLSVDPVPRETRALVPTQTVRIPGSAVRGLLGTSQLVAEGITRVAVHMLHAAEVDQAVLATGDAMTRITHRLLELVAGWGATGEGAVDLDLPITQAQLGAWAGVSRETTVKCLQWLRSADVVFTSRRHIAIVDVPALEKLAGHGRQAPGTPSSQARAR